MCKAHRLVNNSTLGWRVIKKKEQEHVAPGCRLGGQVVFWPVAAGDAPELGLLFSTPEPRVERSMSLAYQPCSEPLHITAK